MKRIIIIFNRDFRDLSRSRSFIVVVLLSLLLGIIAASVTSIVLAKQQWISSTAAIPALEVIMGFIIFFMPLVILTAFIWAFSNQVIIKEKVDGNITSLLATTLSAHEIWIGKSMSIFIPGYIISTLCTIMFLFSVNIFAIKPNLGFPVFSAPLIFTGLFTTPLLLLAILLFMVLFSMANNPDIALAPSFIIGFGLMIGIPLGVLIGKIDLSSWTFSLYYLAGTVILMIVVIIFTKLLTKQNIILSAKE